MKFATELEMPTDSDRSTRGLHAAWPAGLGFGGLAFDLLEIESEER